jgi:acetone monooxygenase
MDTRASVRGNAETEKASSFDVVVIGAGVAGLCRLYELRELGLSVRALEAWSAVGGTWYWNRYPGARLIPKATPMATWFSQELLDEWYWSERLSPDLPTSLGPAADDAGSGGARRDQQGRARCHGTRPGCRTSGFPGPDFPAPHL